MSTIYPGPNHGEFDRDGLPIRKKRPTGTQPAASFASAQPSDPLDPFAAAQPHYPVQPGTYPAASYAQPPYAVAPKSKIVAALLFSSSDPSVLVTSTCTRTSGVLRS
nr:hypothetical protein [Corynebacterium lipophiloflavum]